MRSKSFMNPPAWMLLAVLIGCGQKVPNVVSPEEYELYSAWMKYRYAKQPDGALFLASETAIQNLDHCTEELKRRGVDSLRRQLVDLGEARYLVYPQRSIHSPSPFQEANEFPPRRLHDGGFRYLQFTRVAFNWKHTQALFAVDVGRGYRSPDTGQTEIGGGGGGAVVASKENGAWIFTHTQCIWIE